jgi:ribonuclease P protein component
MADLLNGFNFLLSSLPRSVCLPSLHISTCHEKNFPALPKASCPPVRFSGPHGHQERPRHHQSPPGCWTQAPRRCRNRPQVRPPHAGLIGGRRTPCDDVSRHATAYLSSAVGGAPNSEALPRSAIIRRRTVFDATRAQGRRFTNRYMALSVLPPAAVKSGETGRVAFLTPKRLGAANVRNELRRRMREIYRRRLARSDEATYLVWVARAPALELPFDELTKCMTELRRRSFPAL